MGDEVYTFSSDSELCELLGKPYYFVSVVKRKHPDFTYVDIIRYGKNYEDKQLKSVEADDMIYEFYTDRDLSILLGRHCNYVCQIKQRYKDFTYEDIIKYSNRSHRRRNK